MEVSSQFSVSFHFVLFFGVWLESNSYWLKVFCLSRLLFSWPFGWREQAFVETLSVPIGISGCLLLQLQSGLDAVKRKPRALTAVLFLGS